MSADDVVVIAVKSQDTGAVLQRLRDAAPDVPVFCAQNGIANERSAIRVFERVYGVFRLRAGQPSGPRGGGQRSR